MLQGHALIQFVQARHADDLRAARERHALGVTRLRRPDTPAVLGREAA